MTDIETLTAEALLTLDEAKDYVKRKGDTYVDLINGMINAATWWIEAHCARRLKWRVYTAMLLNGRGSSEFVSIEWPVTTVTAMRERFLTSTVPTRALNLSGYVIQHRKRIVLPYDAAAIGVENVEADLEAGYKVGTHDRELGPLKLACKRLVQVLWQDFDNAVGRGTGFTIQGTTVSLVDHPMPTDVAQLIEPYVRVF